MDVHVILFVIATLGVKRVNPVTQALIPIMPPLETDAI
jgi:hypothetical protein